MKERFSKFKKHSIPKSVKATIYSATFWLLTLIGCDINEAGSEHSDSGNLSSQSIVVKTAQVSRCKFHSSIQSNGKLEAKQKADLIFERSGIVTRVLVQNGDNVTKGQLIALVDTTVFYAELLKARQYLAKAELQMQDLLIVMGYTVMDTSKVLVKRKKESAYILSGIQEMKSQVTIAEKNLHAAKIIAPFDGVVAGLTIQSGSLSSNSETVCILMSQGDLWVNFFILENEFPLIAIDDEVEFSPIAYQSQNKYKARIKSINPKVEKNGLILVKAVVDNPDDKLIDGMNVHLSVKKYKQDVIAINKGAVQDRQGRNVVFTYVDGVAKWKYVTLGIQTADSIEITNGLETGDLLVLEGQPNLGHDTDVILEK